MKNDGVAGWETNLFTLSRIKLRLRRLHDGGDFGIPRCSETYCSGGGFYKYRSRYAFFSIGSFVRGINTDTWTHRPPDQVFVPPRLPRFDYL